MSSIRSIAASLAVFAAEQGISLAQKAREAEKISRREWDRWAAFHTRRAVGQHPDSLPLMPWDEWYRQGMTAEEAAEACKERMEVLGH